MRCPVCTNEETKVVDSRTIDDGLGVRRRRECAKCDFRFSTVEAVEIFDLTVLKSDGRREPYQREKLESGLRHSLEKRSKTPEQFRALIGTIERDIQCLRKSEVNSKEIGEIVMDHLRRFDSVAYIRFASIYRSFEDVQTFQEEVKKLVSKSQVKKIG
ncbi:MAG: transcriptional regulator NrdR [Patescibacteria group bacterium]